MELGFWKKLKKPIMAVSPMSGVTDQAFRKMLSKYGKPDVFWTEFVSVEGLFSKGRDVCLETLKFSKKPAFAGGERPIVAQIFGADPALFEKSAKLLVKLGFDGIDINMGCPDRNIEKKGGGAMLIKNPALAKEIIRATKKGAGKIPVSVKTRIGYEKNDIEKWIPALLEEKIAVLGVHFRTKKELYFGKAHWELAREIARLRDLHSPGTLVLGNGDIKTLEEAKKLVKENGLDGAMIGRGLLGDPWFFSGKTPTLKKRLIAVIEHAKIFEENAEHFSAQGGPAWGWDSMKKHFHASVKGFRGAKELREQLMKVKNSAEAKKAVQDFLEKSDFLVQ